MIGRRDFLKGCLALGALSVLPVSAGQRSARKLVLIHLFGGNDGLNTVVPVGDGLYRKLRPQLALAAGQVLTLQKGLGLHPALADLHTLWGRGKLAILQGVGYADPNRSHFISTDIWQSAGSSREQGWLGKLAQQQNWGAVQVDDTALVRALWSEQNTLCYRPESERLSLPSELDALYSQSPLRQVYAGMKELPRCPGQAWKGAPLRQKLGGVLDLWERGRVFHTSLGGFDTHGDQLNRQHQALHELGSGLSDFYAELLRRGWEKDCCIAIYSEFGRRVEANASGGTDHGGAGPVFLLGGGVAGGLYGEHPSLSQLQDGDLRHATDFRQVYASLLEGWLEVDSAAVLGSKFEKLGCWC